MGSFWGEFRLSNKANDFLSSRKSLLPYHNSTREIFFLDLLLFHEI